MILKAKDNSTKSEQSHLSMSTKQFGVTDLKKRSELLLISIVDRLGTSLNLPEQEVIKQDDYEENFCMYFVGTGNCKVRVRD